MVKTSAGIYIQDRHFPLLECIVNFVSSYFLAMKFGLKGAIIGSIISSMLVSFFSQPFFSYKIIFNKKPTKFYFKYLIYTLFSFSEIFICYYFSSLININSDFTQMLVNSILCLIISSFMNIIFFHKTKEFKHLISAFREVFPVFGKS